MRKLIASITFSLFLLIFGIASYSKAQVVNVTPSVNSAIPGYITGRFYPVVNVGIASATAYAVGLLDTSLLVVPFSPQNFSIQATSINVRTPTLAVGCAIKMAVWAHSVTTKRPTGLPIAGSDTPQSCAGSNTTQSVAINFNFQVGVTYWYGVAVTTLGANFVSINGTQTSIEYLTGGSAVANQMTTALSTPFTYANNIMTTADLTSATFTDQTAAVGMPVMFLGN